MSKKVYIAGAMSGLPEYNYPAFFKAEKVLLAKGYNTINPARLGVNPKYDWRDYMIRAIPYLLQADLIYLLPGWELSKGARLECHIARELSIPIITSGDLHREYLWEFV